MPLTPRPQRPADAAARAAFATAILSATPQIRTQFSDDWFTVCAEMRYNRIDHAYFVER